MFTAILFSLILGPTAQAKTECYQLLQFPAAERRYHAADIESATEWMEKLVGKRDPVGFAEFLSQNGKSLANLYSTERRAWLGRYALSYWQQVGSINHSQRMAALGVELRKLSPGGRRPLLTFNAKAELDALSAQNLERLLHRLDELYPVSNADHTRAQKLIEKWDFSFHFLSPIFDEAPTRGINPPLLSRHDMNSLGLSDDESDFFSDFVGESMSVGFSLVTSANKNPPFNMGAYVARNSFRLNDEFAHENGFYVPQFENILNLMQIMSKWDPEALEDQLRFMRFTLPAEVQTVADMKSFITVYNLKEIFPKAELFQRAVPLRRHLRGFVLNADDGDTFLRAAFARFLIVASRSSMHISDLERAWDRLGGPQQVWRGPFMEFLGLGNIRFRVPGSVPPTQYTIIHKDPHPGRSADYLSKPIPPWDSRRLDHGAKP